MSMPMLTVVSVLFGREFLENVGKKTCILCKILVQNESNYVGRFGRITAGTLQIVCKTSV